MNKDTVKLNQIAFKPPCSTFNDYHPFVLLALLSLENIGRLRALCAPSSPTSRIIGMARQHPTLTSYIAAANLECRPNRRILPSLRGRLMHNCLRVSPANLQPFPTLSYRRNKSKRDFKSIINRKNNHSYPTDLLSDVLSGLGKCGTYLVLGGFYHRKDIRLMNYYVVPGEPLKKNDVIQVSKSDSHCENSESFPLKSISSEQAIQLASMTAKNRSPVLEELLEEVLIHSEKRLSRGKFLKKAKSNSEKVPLDVIHNASNITSESSVVFPSKPVLARSSFLRSSSLLKVDNVLRTLSSITGKHIKKRWAPTLSTKSLPSNLENVEKTYLSDSSDSIFSLNNSFCSFTNSSPSSKSIEARGDNQSPNTSHSRRSILKRYKAQSSSMDTLINNNVNSNNYNNIIGSGDVETRQEYIFDKKVGQARRCLRGKKVQWNPNAEVFYYADSKLTLLRRASIPLREVTIPSAERYKNSICLDLHMPYYV